MILDQFLNESSFGYAEDVEATNEGFDFEFGGFERVIELAESDTHKLNMAMMASEVQSVLALNENNQAAFEQIQEASIKGFFEKVKEIVKKMWARMKEVFNTVIMYFDKFFNQKGFVERANKALSKLSNSDFDGLEFDGYVYTLNAVDPLKMYNNMRADIESKCTSGTTSSTEEEAKKICDELKSEDFKNSLISSVLANSSDATFESDISKALRNGKDTKESLKFNKSECTKVITNFKSAKSQIESSRKSIDESHKKTLDFIKKIETGMTQSEKNKDKKYIKDITHAAANLATYMQSKTNKAISLKITALKEEKNQQKNLIMKAISVGNKNKRQNNSVISDDDYISNLMNQF